MTDSTPLSDRAQALVDAYGPDCRPEGLAAALTLVDVLWPQQKHILSALSAKLRGEDP